ncbi:MAG TPA: ABC transporter permease [Chitinophagaceae bacterium]|nr:ABC transporter permease [Chitinophagaceae bacterium]
MLKNYFKIAWRNIVRSKGYSALNIFGLATGMAVALLIGLWVYNEYSYDRFLPAYQQLSRVQRNFDSNGDTLTFRTTSLKLADALRTQIPEIEYVAESDWMGSHGLLVGDKKLYMRGARVGSDFLKMFQYPLLKGDARSVMQDPYSIVLTASAAKALFGNENPINKMLRLDNQNDLKVTGILKDLPGNSSLQFNYLVPFSYFEQTSQNVRSDRAGGYGQNGYQIFVKLKPGIPYAQVAPKIRNIEHTEKGNINAMNSYVTFQPLQRWHLYSNYVNGKDMPGFLEYVKIFSIIGILVLLIACINFINLTTARSEKRAREVGVRKAVGSQRKDLILQFLTESFLITMLAFLFSLLFVQLSLPAFNRLTGNEILIPYASGSFQLLMIGCVFITALLAGSRPAFYLSSFQPVKVLKGNMKVGKAATLPRKILVVLQFSCSVALIISTIIIYQQVEHAKNRPSGYDLNRMMETDMNSDLNKNYTALKNELLQKGIAESVSTASSPATNIYWHSDIDRWPGKNEGETVEMGTIVVAEDYFKTLGMNILQGNDFKNTADTTSVIFNETAIKRLRLKNPVNQLISWNGKQYRIAGVVKDALMLSPFGQADPTMFLTEPDAGGNLMYRLSPRIKTQDALVQLTAIFNKYNPAFPYDYQFADENYAAKFTQEVLIGKLAGIFASLAIFISCLGLFGLAAYIAEQRTKEIGIRKVLGATVSQVWLLLSKDFIVLVLISCAIAVPVALYFLQGWLQKYDYRITIGPGVFIVSAIVAVLITIITISFQAIKAAGANPVKSLRTE